MKPKSQTNTRSSDYPLKSEHVRFLDMGSEELGKYVAEQTARVFHRLADLRPLYEELWKRFGKLKKGETILGCRTRTEYAEKVLGKSMRSIQYALYGRQLHSVKEAILSEENEVEAEEAWEEPSQEEEEEIRKEAERLFRIFEEKRRQRASAPPADDFSKFFPMLPVKPPPLKDISEFASLGRQAAAKKYHPDRGGNAERMAALNHVADWLEGLASMAASRRKASTEAAA